MGRNLQDIHWRAAEVLVCRTKTGRDRLVPLLQEAGEALSDYVRAPEVECIGKGKAHRPCEFGVKSLPPRGRGSA
jgi:hypothetical protein